MTGFRFKEVDSNTLGWHVLNIDMSLLPPPKTVIENALDKDGSYDFSELNRDKRIHYDDRTIFIDVDFVAKDPFKLENAISDLAKVIAGGYGELILPTMPDTVWIARIESGDSVLRELKNVGVAKVPFRVKPFSFHRAQSEKNPLRWMDCILPWENTRFGWDISKKSFSFNGVMNASIYNLGDVPSSPIITVSGTFKEFSISFGDKFITFKDSSPKTHSLEFDFIKQIVTDFGISVMDKVSGMFWEFPLGEALVKFTPVSPTSSINADVNMIHQFFYKAVI